jgi:hypothetical protein
MNLSITPTYRYSKGFIFEGREIILEHGGRKLQIDNETEKWEITEFLRINHFQGSVKKFLTDLENIIDLAENAK